MGNDNWYGKNDYQQILNELKSLDPGSVSDTANLWDGIANELNAASVEIKSLSGKLGQDDFWTGAAADAAKQATSTSERNVALDGEANSLATVTRHVADTLRGDSRTLQASVNMANSHSPAPEKKKDPDDYAKKLKELQGYAQSTYTNPLSGEQRKFQSAYNPQTGGDTPNPVINNNGGGGGNGGGSGGGQGTGGANNLTDGLADKNTKPAFSDGSGNQSGQGQGAGAGSGGGSGGGSPQSGSGGSGSGLGNALSGLGGGSDKTGSGLPLGSTTAAGYSSSSGSGSGTGTLSGPGALRGGAGVPGLGGSAGTNPAGIGGAGIRGGATGMGGMGMAPMGGAHGRGGHGEEDDEHETPEFLINWDNGNELFGDLPKASPGVIGDWSEHERAEQQRRESEKRRYKSLGWNVDFGDER
ncbi:hypothetical protein [Mycobacteroides immunogenum]|uniref:PPE family domain-containing protein n=1 Tax=Mycobacteroides immunogenum TaxID=83262 RepID=A0A7V8RWX5_9MYCO|nr:hypothetical protein [Mycobacteroides immunogenum]AMT70096.1 hypothetical protein ABG82_06875 [Mycobacteroides immunogenum]ANO03160.1 hypothetical protein BAB75_06925 [Mycobacteroides immunogenum]KIU40915.1 hypothetical protein TL11_09880 [Mycobacteroides immunogenum]KPG10039.1 hypothetical protein AN909_12245 [Mycobacteroides immunogenum]KPG12268.1 hypothetical protein AN908_12020 [Mycobacteroides immunogenum]